MLGTLFVVATPIGNLEDLTFRALRTLKEVNLIAAEDTRRTRKLLSHYQISKPMVSLHEHNEHREAPRLVERLLAGESIALVSDAGTPGISDPGSGLVRLARGAGVSIVAIPGPSAVTAALSVSGLPLGSFVFMGFPPAGGAARAEWFETVAAESRPVVFFEAPHRIERTIADAISSFGKRQIFAIREITKKFEQLVECTIDNMSGDGLIRSKGEFTLVVGQIQDDSSATVEPNHVESMEANAVTLVGQIADSVPLSIDDAVKAAAGVVGMAPLRLRKLVKRARYARNRDAERDSR